MSEVPLTSPTRLHALLRGRLEYLVRLPLEAGDPIINLAAQECPAPDMKSLDRLFNRLFEGDAA